MNLISDKNLAGLHVTVMGLGTFGGGLGAVRFLVARGARVTVTDLRTAEELAGTLAALHETPPAELHLGAHREHDFQSADLVVASPAIPKDSPYLALAVAAGIPITSEIAMFWERNRGRMVCITGSNGKSTTTAMVHACWSACCPTRCWLGGNIGTSLLPVVDQISEQDWVILELSSFQLEDLAALHPSPDVAIVTNFSPNHLDRHGTLDRYRQAKQNLLCWQTADQVAVLNQADADVALWPTAARTVWSGLRDLGREGAFAIDGQRTRFRFDGQVRDVPLQSWLPLPGQHNLQNALAAAASVVVGLGSEPASLQPALTEFVALPHRLQRVAERDGRVFYNDSKATTPEATCLALDSFSQPVILLAGGYDKQVDLTPIAQAIVSRQVRAVALLGQTASTLSRQIGQLDPTGLIARQTFGNFAEAFDWAAGQSQPGDVVLLSPGCASYDWFRNYEERGEAFSRRAREWLLSSPPVGQ